MNYFAHGRRFLDDPYFLAGTAVPDWLSVVDRGVRSRAKHADALIDDSDALIARVAQGIVQHHRDDEWFHKTRAFAELSLSLTVKIRESMAADHGFRPSFLGHILVELLLDAVLIERDQEALHHYYRAMKQADPAVVELAVNRISPHATDKINLFLPRFCQERFLWDYAEDGKLTGRLNQVLRRVGLSPLTSEFEQILPDARRAVCERADELMTE